MIDVITKCDSSVYYKVRQGCVTKCDSYFITKCDWGYYKVRQVLQSVIEVITKCDRYYKVWLRLSQSATGITKCDDYYKVRQYREPMCRLSPALDFLLPPSPTLVCISRNSPLSTTVCLSAICTSSGVFTIFMRFSKRNICRVGSTGGFAAKLLGGQEIWRSVWRVSIIRPRPSGARGFGPWAFRTQGPIPRSPISLFVDYCFWIWDGFSTKMPALQSWKPDERPWIFFV